jgi:hypothetical protein
MEQIIRNNQHIESQNEAYTNIMKLIKILNVNRLITTLKKWLFKKTVKKQQLIRIKKINYGWVGTVRLQFCFRKGALRLFKTLV